MSAVPGLQQHWIKIDLGALASNVRVLKQALGGDAGPKLMAVVKANAYGHGAARVAPVFRDAGADWFGVTTLDEALELVEAGIDSRATPILCFAPMVNHAQVRTAIARDLHMTVCDAGQIGLVTDVESEDGARAHIHLKVDTGMGRLGLGVQQARETALLRDDWDGIYTHFARASEGDLSFTAYQLAQYLEFCADCGTRRIGRGVRHCANSAGALRLPDARLDMVRMGTALYGQMPSESVPRPEGLRADTFQVQAQVVFVHGLSPGHCVGYGSEFTARKPMRAAVIPIGFADGFGVAPSSLYRGWRGVKQVLAERDPARQPFVLIDGQRAPVLGRVAMQMIVVDVTDHKRQVEPGAVADIPMRRLSASARLPRRYD